MTKRRSMNIYWTGASCLPSPFTFPGIIEKASAHPLQQEIRTRRVKYRARQHVAAVIYVSAVVGLFALLGMVGVHVYRKDRQEMKQRLGYGEEARHRAQQVIGKTAFTVDRFVMTLA